MTPYREDQNPLVVLDKLDARPVTPIRALAAMMTRAKPIRNGPPAKHCKPDVAESAEALDLVHLGALTEAGRAREVWVDPGRTLQLHASPTIRFFSTYFDDGSCVLTFGHEDPVTNDTPSLVVHGGTGTVEGDFAAHEQQVARWCAARSCAPIRVDNIAMAARLVRFYYRHVVAPTNMMSMMLAIVFLVVMLIVIVYRALAHHGNPH